MKVTNKTLMINVEHEISVGNDAITATVIHQICLFKGKNNNIDVDVDFTDITDVEFMGIKIGDDYNEYRKFKSQMGEMGIDVDKLVNDECVGLITAGDIHRLKNEYGGLVK